MPRAPHLQEEKRDKVPGLLLALRERVRFCQTKGSAAKRDWSPKLGLTPGNDCFTQVISSHTLSERVLEPPPRQRLQRLL